jgi:hypothetical protein
MPGKLRIVHIPKVPQGATACHRYPTLLKCMGSTHKSIRVPTAVWEAFSALTEREDGPFSEYLSPNAAAVGLLVWPIIFNQRKHTLCAAIARLKPVDRDLVYAFLNWTVQDRINLVDHLPKPATAKSILSLAKAWHTPNGFRKPA